KMLQSASDELKKLSEFLKDVAHKMLWPEPEDQIRENVTRVFYGLDLSNKCTLNALKPLVKHDLTLYGGLQIEC
ncbi:MAG: hypothetical protein V3R56_02465, partial [Xanthomonadales bacterium]